MGIVESSRREKLMSERIGTRMKFKK